MISEEAQLANLMNHPKLCEHFNGDAAITPIPYMTLDEVFVHIGEFGKPLLSMHDDNNMDVATRVKDFVCSLHPRNGDNPIIASGSTPMIAALRCLMEISYQIEGDIEQGLRELLSESDAA